MIWEEMLVHRIEVLRVRKLQDKAKRSSQGGASCSRFRVPDEVGNLGRNTLTAPGSATVDLAIRKRAPVAKLSDAAALEIRVEGFNILNRPNFDAPAATLFNALGQPMIGAGTISGTRGSPRQLQVALRLSF